MSSDQQEVNIAVCVQEQTLTKRSWTPQEDQTIVRLVQMYGASNWAAISSGVKGRTGKQCRERYHNHLQPDIKKGDWTDEENKKIVELQAKYGNQWARITKELPGRTDNAVKNRWHAAMRTQQRLVCPPTKKKSSSGVSKAAGEIPPLNFANLPGRSSSSTMSSTNNTATYTRGDTGNIPSDGSASSSGYGVSDGVLGSPPIVKIVRKYSPRFEAEMKLSDVVDLNLLYHDHQAHGHSQESEDGDHSYDMGIRQPTTPVNRLPSLFCSPISDSQSQGSPINHSPFASVIYSAQTVTGAKKLNKRNNSSLDDKSSPRDHAGGSAIGLDSDVLVRSEESHEDYASLYKRHKMQNAQSGGGMTKNLPQLPSLQYHPSSLKLSSSWDCDWAADFDVPMFTQQLERSISDDAILEIPRPETTEPEASYELFEAMEISPRTNQLLLNIMDPSPVTSPRPESSSPRANVAEPASDGVSLSIHGV